MLAVAVSLAATGCSGGRARTLSAAALPPGTVAELAPTIDPLVAPLGLRLARAELVRRGSGRHLALYLQPVDAYTDDRYIDTIVPLAAVLTPFVLRRWPGLGSYDVCQEPAPGVDDRAVPDSVTVLDVDRHYGAATDWSRARLSKLVADTLDHRPGIVVGVTSRLSPLLDRAAG